MGQERIAVVLPDDELRREAPQPREAARDGARRRGRRRAPRDLAERLLGGPGLGHRFERRERGGEVFAHEPRQRDGIGAREDLRHGLGERALALFSKAREGPRRLAALRGEELARRPNDAAQRGRRVLARSPERTHGEKAMRSGRAERGRRHLAEAIERRRRRVIQAAERVERRGKGRIGGAAGGALEQRDDCLLTELLLRQRDLSEPERRRLRDVAAAREPRRERRLRGLRGAHPGGARDGLDRRERSRRSARRLLRRDVGEERDGARREGRDVGQLVAAAPEAEPVRGPRDDVRVIVAEQLREALERGLAADARERSCRGGAHDHAAAGEVLGADLGRDAPLLGHRQRVERRRVGPVGG